MGENNVLWSGRLGDKPEAEAFAFQASIKIDRRLVYDDIQGSKAHAAMLGLQGVISVENATKISNELDNIAEELEDGSLEIDLACEDIHSFLEAELTRRLGAIGKMVHAGRSRNDQVVTAFRLYLKRIVPLLQIELTDCLNVLLDTAEANVNSIMPGYTHLQRAQPVTLAHHLTAWACALERDLSRFSDALVRLDECPLGSGALAATTLPLDRKATAEVLGFARPGLNSMDAVADRDFAMELSAACAITMVHLSRFCEDIVLWASEEFGFISLAESWSTGSSIMPQKKNPDFAELIRGKSGRTIGNLVTLLSLLKGLPYAYNKDMQEDKRALLDSLYTLRTSLRIFHGMMQDAEFNVNRMKAACKGGFLEATDTAEYLVRKGLPFRDAHEVTALVVRDCIEKGHKHISDMELSDLKKRCKLFEEDLFKAITPFACIKARSISGGPAPKEVKKQIKALRRKIK